MARERIHKLAAEWGVESREIVERLEKMGIKGKKAQSVLTESEAKRVHDEMGLGDTAPKQTVRRTVQQHGNGGSAETVITETRIKPGVVLRRTKRTDVGGGATGLVSVVDPALGLQVATWVDADPSALTAFDIGEFAHAAAAARQVAVVEPEIEPEPEEPEEEETEAASLEVLEAVEETVAETEELVASGPESEVDSESDDEEPDKTPVDEPDKLAAELMSHAEARKAEEERGESPRRGAARVLGRIDLNRKPQPALPAKATTPGAPKPEGEGEQKPGRKRKRKVVRKEDMFDAFERSFQARPRKKRAAPGQKIRKTELTVPKASKRVIKINEVTTPGELAKSMRIKAGEILGALMKLGVMKSINDAIDFDTATLVADEFNYTVENIAVNVEELLQSGLDVDQTEGTGESRPPVVTVMGHVDHGKTSLLDAIRHENVVEGEAGGITQHIGAYMVSTPHGEICFLDTPGHAAFTAMRARGASITDIVVLVVAADDGVMPQTIEAINHAKAAKIPVVVAVNKIDKPDANPDRVKQQLSEHGLQPEEWGGDTQFLPVSALKKTGIDELLDAVALLAQILELKAPADRAAHGIVIESRLDKGRGPVATVLVQQGTLNLGDFFVCGEITGRVRAMVDHTGAQVKSAGPSHPVEILGLDAVPQAGDTFDAVEDGSRAAQVADHRREATRKAQTTASARMSLEDLQKQVAAGQVGELKVIIKADVHGSAEALKQALEKLSTDEVTLNVIHTGVGAINESDVQLALASQGIVIGFHVRPEGKARALGEREGADIRLHTVIYEAIDEVKAALEGLLAPDYKEVIEGRAEVRQTFTIPGGVTIAGSYVTDGKMLRNGRCRLLRDNVVVHEGKIGSLKRFKDDAREVQSGYECGIGLDRYNDVKPGDVIECFRLDEIRRKLGESGGAGSSAGASA